MLMEFWSVALGGIAWICLITACVHQDAIKRYFCKSDQNTVIRSSVISDGGSQRSIGRGTVSYSVRYDGGYCGADGGGADGCG